MPKAVHSSTITTTTYDVVRANMMLMKHMYKRLCVERNPSFLERELVLVSTEMKGKRTKDHRQQYRMQR